MALALSLRTDHAKLLPIFGMLALCPTVLCLAVCGKLNAAYALLTINVVGLHVAGAAKKIRDSIHVTPRFDAWIPASF